MENRAPSQHRAEWAPNMGGIWEDRSDVNRVVPRRTALYGAGATCWFSVSGGTGLARAALGVKGSQVRILSSRRLGQGPLNRHIPGSAGFCVFLLILWGGRRSWVSRFSACHGRNLGALRFRSRNGVGVWVRVSSLSRCAGCDVFGVAAAGLMRSCRVAGWYRRGCPAWGHVGS